MSGAAKNIQYFAEYAALLPFYRLVNALSLPAAMNLMSSAADIVYVMSARRRRIAVENLLHSGICADDKAARSIARKSFRHFQMVILESLKSDEILGGASGTDRMIYRFPEEFQRDLNDPARGVILATGHFGCWEIAAQALSLRKPVAGVTRGIKNPYVNRLMQQRKPRHQFHLIPKYDRGHTTRFLRLLKDGEILALMIDQHASWGGMLVDFFGRPAHTYTTVPLLNLVTRAPLYFGCCTRTGRFSYELTATGPFLHTPTGSRCEDIKKILETLNRELETVIRATPDQYLWAHRRWKKQSPEE